MFPDLADKAVAAYPEATDLFLHPGRPLTVRIEGRLEFVDEQEQIREQTVLEIVQQQMPKRPGDDKVSDLDGPPGPSRDVVIAGAGTRWRVNMYRCRGIWHLAARRLSENVPSLSSLGFGGKESIFLQEQGLVVIAGPAGAGKTTTMAAAVSLLLAKRPCHVVTVEDPVEYILPPGRGLVSQRETMRDCPDFAIGLQDALRQTPQVIMLGEMREREAANAVFRAAETGHTVFTTVHAHSLEDAVGRMVHIFSGDDAARARSQIASTLKLLLVQRLLPLRDGGRKLVYEGVFGTPAARGVIRRGEEKTLKQTAREQHWDLIADQRKELIEMGLVDAGSNGIEEG
jgi:twitching motility protein PilT